jgi:NADH:ubiquinone oxidoreductase subunit 5 (subunit L)/multisubunit Na+/H+ antiporter MnhA subunit
MSAFWLNVTAILLLAAPLAALVLQAVPAWLGRPLSERAIGRLVGGAFALSTVAGTAAGAVMWWQGLHEFRLPLMTWFGVGHYRFQWELVLDALSVPFAILGAALVGLIGSFSRRYLHKDLGFGRFYLLITLLGAGVSLVVLAGALDTLVLGWELVGLASALLISFFHDRRRPVEHGLRAFTTYRVCDVGILGAAAWLHHAVGTTAMVRLSEPWGGLPVPSQLWEATVIGLLILWGTMGKSAQVPLSGWLPRAMEGPTPSSAIFYGALSIHLGPFLLLRAASLLDAAPIVAWTVVAVGALTAMHGSMVGRVQSDIKSALAYASLTQVGLIFMEIGLGFRLLAVAHVLGHAIIRTLQILRSPSLLHDQHHLEQAMGMLVPPPSDLMGRWLPPGWQPWLYRHALERGYLDSWLRDYLVGPFLRLVRFADALERRWAAFLAGRPAAATDPAAATEAR